MGTRSLSSIKVKGMYYTQYSQFDGYLSGKGIDFAKAIAAAYPYLVSVRTSKGDAEYFKRAEEIGKAWLWQESLLTGHGWRFYDAKGECESYTEGASITPALSSWIEYIRVADFDNDTLTFYGATPKERLYEVSMSDLVALEQGGLKALELAFQDWEQGKRSSGPKLEIRTGARIPVERGWEGEDHMRDYAVLFYKSKPVYASMFAPPELAPAGVKP